MGRRDETLQAQTKRLINQITDMVGEDEASKNVVWITIIYRLSRLGDRIVASGHTKAARVMAKAVDPFKGFSREVRQKWRWHDLDTTLTTQAATRLQGDTLCTEKEHAYSPYYPHARPFLFRRCRRRYRTESRGFQVP